MNKNLVLNVVRQLGPLSRAQIAKRTKITRATISEIVNELLAEKTVFEEGPEDTPHVGRKGILLRYNASLGYGLAIDLGGTKISFSLFNLNAEMLSHKQIPSFPVQTRHEFTEMLIAAISDYLSQHLQNMSYLQVIGIATPGIVDNANGVVLEGAPNLPEWENVKLGELLEEAFGVPAVVENDVRAALIGEMWKGKCRNVRSAALITLGTGIGSALLIDGKLVRGTGYAAGEIGYLLFNREHLRQTWSKKGCFETLSSGSGLISRVSGQADGAEGKSRWNNAAEIFASAREENNEARELVEEMGDYLSLAVINLIFTTNPDVIVLVGGLTNSADLFVETVNENIRRHSFERNRTEVVVSELKELGPLYGISILSLGRIQPSIVFLEGIKLT